MTLSTTAIVVSYNSAAVLGAALASLPSCIPALVVDNASTDSSATIASSAGAQVMNSTTNEGFGRGNNRGLREASTDWLLLFNPDAVILPGFMEAMTEAAAAFPQAAALVPSITTSKGLFTKHDSVMAPATFRSDELAPGIRSISFASGGVMLVRRDVMLSIGGFDDAIFLYFEDDDLSRRLLDAGHAILLVESAKAHHTGNVSTPPTPELTAMKHWHMAWSERHVRQKFGMAGPGYWRVIESFVKLQFARLTGDTMEQAKQKGLIDGTIAHMRGVKAQDIKDRIRS